MKIAQIAPVWLSIPPKKYGGTEAVISDITEGLVKKGHDVTLFATGDSKTSAKLVSFEGQGVLERGLSFNDYLYQLNHLLSSLEKKEDFDILHFHFTSPFDFVTMSLVKDYKNVAFTIHNPIPPMPFAQGLDFRKRFLEEKFSQIPIVSISNNQRAGMKLNFVSTIYHGIDVSKYAFDEKNIGQENLFYLGRISPIKGAAEAMDIAEKTGKKLVLAGKVEAKNPMNLNYFEEKVKPRLDQSWLQKLEDLDFSSKVEQYLKSKIYLFPIQWEEPFGLVMLEAMACGTPVIAFARGSVPEVIKDGETGFIVNSSEEDKRGDFIIKKTGIEGFCEAVEKIYAMPPEEYQKMRSACRKNVEDRFTTDKMVEGYEKAYQEILKNSQL
jgi:glycosyltransferase involved in cell wall biosynthesis